MKRLACLVLIGAVLVASGWLGSQRRMNPRRLAEQAYLRGEYVLALELYQHPAATETDPGLTAFNRAATLYQLGLLDLAARDFQTASRTGTPHRSARARYDLGNCALRMACRMPPQGSADLLREAIELYDACMIRIGTHDQELLENAWHNQQLARSLLAEMETNQPRQPHLTGRNQPRTPDPSECEH